MAESDSESDWDSVPAPTPTPCPSPSPGPDPGVAMATPFAFATAPTEANHDSTALCMEEIDAVQGIVSVVVSLSLSLSSEPDAADTSVVVMGTEAGGMSSHPHCSMVTTVVRHVAVGVGHVNGCLAQIVVYVVQTVTGDTRMLVLVDADEKGVVESEFGFCVGDCNREVDVVVLVDPGGRRDVDVVVGVEVEVELKVEIDRLVELCTGVVELEPNPPPASNCVLL